MSKSESTGKEFYQTAFSYSNSPNNSSKLFAIPSGPGMSCYVSASSLQHASPTISFPKSDRFPHIKTQDDNSSQQIQIPGTTSPKTCTFGFGNKNFFHQHILRNAKEFPSPDRYTPIPTTPGPRPGKSFGIPYQFYAKTYIPGYRMQSIEFAKEYPSVGMYEVAKEPGQDKLKFSIFGKRSERNINESNPACNHYKPTYILEENQRYKKLTFGKGTKFDFTKAVKNNNPGPGAYVLPSPFDKFDPNKRSYKKITGKRTAFA